MGIDALLSHWVATGQKEELGKESEVSFSSWLLSIPKGNGETSVKAC